MDIKKIKSLLSIGIVAFALALSQNCYADTDLYQVDLIVFSYNDLSTNNEIWGDLASLPNTEKAITLSPDIADENNYKLLSDSSSHLKLEKSILSHNPQYQVLLDKSWTQFIKSGSLHNSRPVHITGGNLYNENSDLWEVNGTINISRSIYFDVNVDLALTEPVSNISDKISTYPVNPLNSSYASFRLNSIDRMRSNEPCYFDHPLFGVIVLITKKS